MSPWIAHNTKTIRRERRDEILSRATIAVLLLTFGVMAAQIPQMAAKSILEIERMGETYD